MARVFDLISSEYGWDDDQILDKTLRRIRQIIAAISERKFSLQKEQRLIASWQTRSLAMVMAAAGGNGNEELMQYAANLTIDNEEYEEFSTGKYKAVESNKRVPVHATTQEAEVEKNFEAAADRNSSEILAMFGQGLEKGKPGHD